MDEKIEEISDDVTQLARDLLIYMLKIDPNDRPTASECLKHKAFDGIDTQPKDMFQEFDYNY